MTEYFFDDAENFNSHAHVERDITWYTIITGKRYFNSHAHVERDLMYQVHLRNHIISTHTLTWSVTNLTTCISFIADISTHTLTWSVTHCTV